MAAALGAKGLLVAMIANEMLTNGTYQTALELPCPDEVRKLLERNFADEQRHLRWLLEARDQVGVEFPGEPALSS
jgi:rubrerythrin